MERGKTGSFIAECRKEMGYSQKQLAERLNVTEQAVSRWERGIGYPDITLLIPLANELNVSVLEVMEGCRMKKEVSKQEMEHSLAYYMASSMDSRKPLGHAITGLIIWLGIFFSVGMFLVFMVAGEAYTGAGAAAVLGYYFSMGSLISIFWAEKVKSMAAEYGVIAEREYQYQKQEGIEDKPVPFILIPPPMDAYRKFHPGIMPMKWKDGTELKVSELFLGFCKVVAIMLSSYFWWRMLYGFEGTGFSRAVVAASPFIIAGVGLATHGIYQVVQSRDTYESTDLAKIKIAIGIVLAVLPTMVFWMLMMAA